MTIWNRPEREGRTSGRWSLRIPPSAPVEAGAQHRLSGGRGRRPRTAVRGKALPSAGRPHAGRTGLESRVVPGPGAGPNGVVLSRERCCFGSGATFQGREAGRSGLHFGSGSFRHLIHRLPLGPRDAAFLAATFLTVDFLVADLAAGFLAVDFLAVDFMAVLVFADAFLAVDLLAVDALTGAFLGSVPSDLVFFPSRAGSILAAPAPGANTLSCPSFHRTRYWTRRSPSITSMISPFRAGPPTRRGLTTMRSPFLATRPPSCRGASASSGTAPEDSWGSRLRSVRYTLIGRGLRREPDPPWPLADGLRWPSLARRRTPRRGYRPALETCRQVGSGRSARSRTPQHAGILAGPRTC